MCSSKRAKRSCPCSGDLAHADVVRPSPPPTSARIANAMARVEERFISFLLQVRVVHISCTPLDPSLREAGYSPLLYHACKGLRLPRQAEGWAHAKNFFVALEKPFTNYWSSS